MPFLRSIKNPDRQTPAGVFHASHGEGGVFVKLSAFDQSKTKTVIRKFVGSTCNLLLRSKKIRKSRSRVGADDVANALRGLLFAKRSGFW